MVTEAQVKANRRNAARSTGPRTEGGKRRSGQNATNHGLTTAPPGDEIARWYRCILGETEERTHDGIFDPRRSAALTLAEAEARLSRARNVEESYLLSLEEDRDLAPYLRTVREIVTEIWLSNPGKTPEVERHPLELRGRVPHEIKRITSERWTDRYAYINRLARHRRAAEVARSKALREWISLSGT